ncbi:retinal-binding protein-like isoform X2 [Watersipora subatra]|uniref:retinal-binding protein-like isoform X2 n=1 Tax=Watersipora subatra TaxID=2589382 RepID=UPI00355C4642
MNRGSNRLRYSKSRQQKARESCFNMEYELTIRQQETLDKFGARIADIRKPDWDDHYLTKWLVARNFDLAKSEEMLRNSMKYREKMRVDDMMEEFDEPEVLQKYLVGGMCGYDKDGLPIRIEPFGDLDMKGIMRSVKKSDLEKVAIKNCEMLMKECKYQSKLKEKRIDGFTLIFDMANFSRKMLWKPGLNVYMHNAEILQNNYPEMQKRMFIINSPKLFPILWKIAQPILSEESKKKIKVLDKNYKEELLKYIDEDQLPAYLGGTMTGPDGDPKCSHKICHGGDVPKAYYIDESTQTKSMDKASVAPGNELKIECEVASPGSVLSWRFKTEDKDIGFGVNLKADGEAKDRELLPTARVDSHILEQDGILVCEKAGKYYLIFDNSYSWTSSKKLYYTIDVFADDDGFDLETDPVTG